MYLHKDPQSSHDNILDKISSMYTTNINLRNYCLNFPITILFVTPTNYNFLYLT